MPDDAKRKKDVPFHLHLSFVSMLVLGGVFLKRHRFQGFVPYHPYSRDVVVTGREIVPQLHDYLSNSISKSGGTLKKKYIDLHSEKSNIAMENPPFLIGGYIFT